MRLGPIVPRMLRAEPERSTARMDWGVDPVRHAMGTGFHVRANVAFAITGLLATSIALADTTSEDARATALTPEAIYVRAVRAMKSAAVPPYVTFRETIAARNIPDELPDVAFPTRAPSPTKK